MSFDLQRLALQIAEKLREIGTRQGNVPFDKGDLLVALEPLEDEGPELPKVAEGPPLEYVDIEVEGDTRRVMEGVAAADAFKLR